MAILQEPDGLGNPRETNTFAIKIETRKWSIATDQIGNNFAHTVRDKSQAKSRFKHHYINGLLGFWENGSFSVKSDFSSASGILANHIRPIGEEIRHLEQP